jgi:hypothetical protein
LREQAQLPQEEQLLPKPVAIPAHHEVHPNEKSLVQRNCPVHRLGDSLGDLFATEHPVAHDRYLKVKGYIQFRSMHRRSSMRARKSMTERLVVDPKDMKNMVGALSTALN